MQFLKSLPLEISLTARLEHTMELVEMFQEYIKAKPEHAEYYHSIVVHLSAIIEGYTNQLEQLKATEECKNNQVH